MLQLCTAYLSTDNDNRRKESFNCMIRPSWFLWDHKLALYHLNITILFTSSQPVGYTYHCMTTVNHTPLLNCFCPMVQQPPVGQGILIIETSRSHSDTSHSLRLLWTGYQPVAETSTWQHTTLARDRYPCPGQIRTRNPSKRTAKDPHLRRRGNWDRRSLMIQC